MDSSTGTPEWASILNDFKEYTDGVSSLQPKNKKGPVWVQMDGKTQYINLLSLQEADSIPAPLVYSELEVIGEISSHQILTFHREQQALIPEFVDFCDKELLSVPWSNMFPGLDPCIPTSCILLRLMANRAREYFKRNQRSFWNLAESDRVNETSALFQEFQQLLPPGLPDLGKFKNICWAFLKLFEMCEKNRVRYNFPFRTIGVNVPLNTNCHDVVYDGVQPPLKNLFCIILFPGILSMDGSRHLRSAYVCR